MTTRDMLRHFVWLYGQNEIALYHPSTDGAIALRQRHRIMRAIEYLMTRLERHDPQYVAVCTWESYRNGEFQGICANVRPCPKHDRPRS